MAIGFLQKILKLVQILSPGIEGEPTSSVVAKNRGTR